MFRQATAQTISFLSVHVGPSVICYQWGRGYCQFHRVPVVWKFMVCVSHRLQCLDRPLHKP